MRSSWAGAMGQPQFLPSSYLKFAVDFDGDGKRDIWNSIPDSLASIANYLAQSGWVRGRDWGFEAVIPQGTTCALEGPDRARPIRDLTAMGIIRISGRPFPEHERRAPGMVLVPAGVYGPEFVVTPNFYVIKEYNNSDLYALFIGNLADRMAYGVGAFVTPWGNVGGMLRSDIAKLQTVLERQGYDVGGADGLPGYKTRRSIGEWQAKNGAQPTCFPTPALLKSLR
jgi:membrane-bound lytic murein transglycosylase B